MVEQASVTIVSVSELIDDLNNGYRDLERRVLALQVVGQLKFDDPRIVELVAPVEAAWRQEGDVDDWQLDANSFVKASPIRVEP